MDDKWRTMSCPICRGYGITWNPESWDGTEECDSCNYGTIWLRPKGHSFQYPGGPACGVWPEAYYKNAVPAMPYDWHSWNHTDKEIENFPVDRSGSFEPTFPIECTCGWYGSIKEHETHVEEKKQEFILEHQSAV